VTRGRGDGRRRVALVVLDSVGIGGAPDAAEFGDEGSATLQHVAQAVGGLSLPTMTELGLGRVTSIEGVPPAARPTGAFGSMTERSPGKDTTTGHWEIAGIILDNAFPTYPEGFPPDIIAALERRLGTGMLGNKPASGTAIIEELGAEHMATGKPIVYTSADSVLQIAAHVEVIAVERLYEMCRIAREVMRGPHEVGRIIARPFSGRPGSLHRTAQRHDFSVTPPGATALDVISARGLEVRGVGKIGDIFASRGLTASRPTSSNDDGVSAVIEELSTIDKGLVFANLVDFDQSFGHRNDPVGYARTLEDFDARLPEILNALGPPDVLILTADHGNDPTTPSSDHSRERVPLLVGGPGVPPGVDLGHRETFADCGATVVDLLDIEWRSPGTSFARAIQGSE
jgi:phosphopentomutase